MKKIITNIVFATLVAITAINAEAIVKPETLAGEFFEGRNISIKGKNISTAVTLTTVDGQTFNLTGVVNKPANKLTLQLPLISQDSKVKLTFADKDGSTSVNIVVYNDTTLPNGGVDIFANATVLPASIETGIAGAQGPEGPEGPQGPQGPQGAPGSIPAALPGSNVVGPVASAFTVLNASQPSITTLPSLVSVGTSTIPTVFAGPITAPEGITGNIAGNSTNFTGTLAGDITGTQSATVLSQAVLFGKTLPAHAAAAGVVSTGDSLEVAVEKLDGNVLANDADITAIQGVNTTQSTNISTLTSTLGAPTSANTANQIVKRDASGNFAAGTITATSFSGPLTGNVTGNLTGNVTGNLTGNVTGNTSGSAATFTGALAGDVTGTQGATVIQPAALYTKTLQASFVPVTGAVSIGDSLEVALEKTTGNITDTVNKTSNNATAIAALNVSVQNLTLRVNTVETDIGDISSDITAIQGVNTTQSNAITAIQGVNTTQSSDITALQTKVNNLTSVSNVTLTSTSFSATDKSVVLLSFGSNNLETIADGTAGQRLTIIFVDAAYINESGNIDIVNPIPHALGLPVGANDVLELVFTGTTWKQISFSNN